MQQLKKKYLDLPTDKKTKAKKKNSQEKLLVTLKQHFFHVDHQNCISFCLIVCCLQTSYTQTGDDDDFNQNKIKYINWIVFLVF